MGTGEKKRVKHVAVCDVVRAALATAGADVEGPADDGASDHAISEASSGAELTAEVALPKVIVAEMLAKCGDVMEYETGRGLRQLHVGVARKAATAPSGEHPVADRKESQWQRPRSRGERRRSERCSSDGASRRRHLQRRSCSHMFALLVARTACQGIPRGCRNWSVARTTVPPSEALFV